MKTLKSFCFYWVFLAAILALGIVGCGGKDVRVYEVAKDNAPVNPHTHPPAAASEAQSQSPLTWVSPTGWEEAPRGEMRLASFKVKGENSKMADVSVIALPGTAGGDLNNVNRWRGQVGLASVKAEELAALAVKVDVGGSEGALYEQTGTAASGDVTRVLAAILHQADVVWFFKMVGDDALVARQKPAFVEFLKSLKFSGATAEQPSLPADHPPLAESSSTLPQRHPPLAQPASDLPHGHPPISGAAATLDAGTDNSPKPQWKVPADWKEEAATQMLIAKFSVGEKSARAEITVSSFPGDVGGLLANVNRWRAQVGLSPLDAAQLAKAIKTLKVQSESGSLVELDNPDGKFPSLIGVAAPHNGQTWFFKMIGDAKTVAREKDAFIKFVQSVKLPNAS